MTTYVASPPSALARAFNRVTIVDPFYFDALVMMQCKITRHKKPATSAGFSRLDWLILSSPNYFAGSQITHRIRQKKIRQANRTPTDQGNTFVLFHRVGSGKGRTINNATDKHHTTTLKNPAQLSLDRVFHSARIALASH